MSNLPEKRIEDVFWAYRDRILDLKQDRRFKYILIFKNHGPLAGATLEHSHGQLIALPIVPKHVVEELEGSKQYYIYKERCVFCDIIRQETETGIRVVAENDGFLTVAPYAPRFPFETWILPKRHESAFENSSSQVYESLAKAVKNLLMRADQVLDNPAYNLVLHTAPAQESSMDHYHWHSGVHAPADEDCRLRVGNRLLSESDTARGSCALSTRGADRNNAAGKGWVSEAAATLNPAYLCRIHVTLK